MTPTRPSLATCLALIQSASTPDEKTRAYEAARKYYTAHEIAVGLKHSHAPQVRINAEAKE